MAPAPKLPLSDAIDRYYHWRASQGLAKNTLRNDRNSLKAFLANIGNIYCHNLTPQHISRHFELRAATRAPDSLRIDHVVLTHFLGYLRHIRAMPADSDPMYGRRAPKVTHRERTRIHVSRFPALLDLAGESCPRNRALIAVLLYTMLRGEDARSLRIQHIDLDDGYVNAAISKTSKQDRLPILADLDAELRTWLTVYSEECGPLEPHWYLLPARQAWIAERGDNGAIREIGSALVPSQRVGQVSRVINPILEDFGVPLRDHRGKSTREGGHTLRRSGARALYDWLKSEAHPDPIRTVQSMLGHKTMALTERYIGAEPERRERDRAIKGKRMLGGDNVIQLHEKPA